MATSVRHGIAKATTPLGKNTPKNGCLDISLIQLRTGHPFLYIGFVSFLTNLNPVAFAGLERRGTCEVLSPTPRQPCFSR
jgi:hypothetical protein